MDIKTYTKWEQIIFKKNRYERQQQQQEVVEED